MVTCAFRFFKFLLTLSAFSPSALEVFNYSYIPYFHCTVYCESCIVNPDEQKLRCQVCPSFHPTGCPKVCLELHNFLVEQFPKELAHRRDDVQLKHVNPTACMSTECSIPFYYAA